MDHPRRCQRDGVNTPNPCADYPDEPLPRALIKRHYLCAAVGAGRLALDPDNNQMIVCECCVIADKAACVLRRRFDDFAAKMIFILGDRAASVLDRAETLRAEAMDRKPALASPAMTEGLDDALILIRR